MYKVKRHEIPLKYRPTKTEWKCFLIIMNTGFNKRRLAKYLKISEQGVGKHISTVIKKIELYCYDEAFQTVGYRAKNMEEYDGINT